MNNIFVFEDDPLFLRQIKRIIGDKNKKYFDSSNSFLDEYKSDSINLTKIIKDTKIFFLDFWIGKNESIVSTGIFQTILNNKSENSDIYFISDESHRAILNSIHNSSLNYTPLSENLIGKNIEKIKNISLKFL